MTFTDDDLKRLKEDIERFSGAVLFHARITALIARLEAAEALLKAGNALKSAAWLKPIQQIMYGDSTGLREYNEALEAYEKAAGKS